MNLDELNIASLAVGDFIGPVAAIFVALAFGKLFLIITDNFVASLMMRLKGYQTHMTVRINGNIATITRIGILSTHFQIINGSDNRIEYMAVSNVRLDSHDVRRLVRVFGDDKQKGKSR